MASTTTPPPPSTTTSSTSLSQAAAANVEKDLADRVGRWSDAMYDKWDNFCDELEASDNEQVQWITRNFLRRLVIEAPVVVGFVFLCIVIHLLNMTVLPGVSFFLGIDDHFTMYSPLQYIRLFSHILAHDGIPHLRGNMTNLLLVGPSAEAIFGSKEILQIIVLVAISSAVVHLVIGKRHTRQLGASGVVFAFILLNSLVSAKSGKIPVSFLLTAFLWIGDEIWRFFFSGDGVSHHAHLSGAIVGTIAGYLIHQQKEKERIKKITNKWKLMSSSNKGKKKE